MSANFDSKRDTNYLLNAARKNLTLGDMEEAIVLASFDAETSQDIDRIEKELIQQAFLKRVCLVKVLLFIPEYFLMALLFPAKIRIGKQKTTSLYWKFLFNKISYDKFNKELTTLLKEGIIT